MNRYFRNIRLYRITSPWPASETDLSDALNDAAFKPCGSFSERSSGFEAPVEGAGDLLCRRVASADLLQLRTQTRVMPNAAVQEALVERVDAFKQRTRLEPNRRERRDLKEEVYADLLPKALLKSDRVQAMYLGKEKILLLGTAAESVAEDFMKNLGRAMLSFQYVPLTFKQPVADFIKRIFMGGKAEAFTLAHECRMRDPADSRVSVNWLDVELADPAVRRHVDEGLKIDRLGLHFDQLLQLVLDEDLVIRKLKLLDQNETDQLPDEDPLAAHDAHFVMMAGCMQGLLNALSAELGGSNG